MSENEIGNDNVKIMYAGPPADFRQMRVYQTLMAKAKETLTVKSSSTPRDRKKIIGPPDIPVKCSTNFSV